MNELIIKKPIYDLQKIYQYMAKNKLSKKAFCEKAKINYQTFRQIEAQNMKVRLSSICRVCKVLEIKLHDIFIRFK